MTVPPGTDEKLSKQRRNLKLLAAGVLVVGGLGFCAAGLYALATGAVEVRVRSYERRKRVFTSVTFQGAQARITGVSFVAIGGSLLLSLLLLQPALDAHFDRSGQSSMSRWRLGLVSAVALLFVGGIVGVVIGFIV